LTDELCGTAQNHGSLEAAGWTRRTVATEPRLAELVEMYLELGFEVTTVEMLSVCGDGKECVECIRSDADPSRYRVIYTRAGGEG